MKHHVYLILSIASFLIAGGLLWVSCTQAAVVVPETGEVIEDHEAEPQPEVVIGQSICDDLVDCVRYAAPECLLKRDDPAPLRMAELQQRKNPSTGRVEQSCYYECGFVGEVARGYVAFCVQEPGGPQPQPTGWASPGLGVRGRE